MDTRPTRVGTALCAAALQVTGCDDHRVALCRAEPRARLRPLLPAAAGVWVLLVLAWIAGLALESWTAALGGELTPGSSVFGTASWEWFPPGVSCTNPMPDGSTLVRGPPGLCWVVIGFLVLAGLALTVAVHRRRR